MGKPGVSSRRRAQPYLLSVLGRQVRRNLIGQSALFFLDALLMALFYLCCAKFAAAVLLTKALPEAPYLIYAAALALTRLLVQLALAFLNAKLTGTGELLVRRELTAAIARQGPFSPYLSPALAPAIAEIPEAVTPYFAAYRRTLRQVMILPALLLIFIAWASPLSALLLAAMCPLIPIFMVLIGRKAKELNDRQLTQIRRLSNRFFEALSQLPFIYVFNQGRRELAAVRRMSRRWRIETMQILYVAFLSALALEFFATVGVAFCAVTLGFAVYDHGFSYEKALFVLLCAPEFFIPLRRLGQNYHAKQRALAAAESLGRLFETPAAAVPEAAEGVTAAAGASGSAEAASSSTSTSTLTAAASSATAGSAASSPSSAVPTADGKGSSAADKIFAAAEKTSAADVKGAAAAEASAVAAKTAATDGLGTAAAAKITAASGSSAAADKEGSNSTAAGPASAALKPHSVLKTEVKPLGSDPLNPQGQKPADPAAAELKASAAEKLQDLAHLPLSRIVFSQVSCRYPDGRMGLQEASFELAGGRINVLTGPSGSGKSTVLNVLAGLIAPASGRVVFYFKCPEAQGGELAVDSTALEVKQRAKLFTFVPQRPFFFYGTLADNLRVVRPEASDAELERALNKAGAGELAAHLNHGLNTLLADNHAGISGGQARLTALARALLKEGPLILLDEPSASLDLKSEQALAAALRTLSGAHTLVIAAHRPALIALADREVQLGAP